MNSATAGQPVAPVLEPDIEREPRYMTCRTVSDEGPDVVSEYVSAEYAWRKISVGAVATPEEIAFAREYVRTIDAYVAVLRARGRRIPYRLDEVAADLRALYGDGPLPRVA